MQRKVRKGVAGAMPLTLVRAKGSLAGVDEAWLRNVNDSLPGETAVSLSSDGKALVLNADGTPDGFVIFIK